MQPSFLKLTIVKRDKTEKVWPCLGADKKLPLILFVHLDSSKVLLLALFSGAGVVVVVVDAVVFGLKNRFLSVTKSLIIAGLGVA